MRPLGLRRTIYYRYVPPARDRQPFKGCLRAPLRASQSDRNNIPYRKSAAINIKGRLWHIKKILVEDTIVLILEIGKESK